VQIYLSELDTYDSCGWFEVSWIEICERKKWTCILLIACIITGMDQTKSECVMCFSDHSFMVVWILKIKKLELPVINKNQIPAQHLVRSTNIMADTPY